MAWDEPTLQVNALIPAQLPAAPQDSTLVDFEVRGTNLISGNDPLRLILVRRDPRIHLLPNQGELVLGGLRPADIIPLIEIDTQNSQMATAKGMLRERSPGTYDLIAYRSPSLDDDGVATNEAHVLRSALVILEAQPQP